ncbi:MAG: 3-demethylubiquinone-9 3-methyltransferase [Pelotomaculum sp. PtaB.Bin104]|nr:MAG: 3-demethylubiquinone-9 3-methyltransferase [Pelotomaculum sp. PtaB.Bin104]
MQKITPHLWFDHQAEEAVDFYTAIFEKSGIKGITRYGEAGANISGMPVGTDLEVY